MLVSIPMSKRVQKRGRPPLPPSERKDARIPVRVTKAQHSIISGKAAQVGKQVSDYMRDKALS